MRTVKRVLAAIMAPERVVNVPLRLRGLGHTVGAKGGGACVKAIPQRNQTRYMYTRVHADVHRTVHAKYGLDAVQCARPEHMARAAAALFRWLEHQEHAAAAALACCAAAAARSSCPQQVSLARL